MQKPLITEYAQAIEEASENLDKQAHLTQKSQEDEVLSTEATNEDLENAVEDEFGVKYSKDGKRLLKATSNLNEEYAIRKGTKVICDSAFDKCSDLSAIHIPDSVTSIGDEAFYCCENLNSIHIPDGVTSIGDRAFDGCKFLTTIHIPDSITSIGNYAFNDF